MSGDDPADIQQTLNDLERRLRELQAELAAPQEPQDAPQAPAPGPPPMPPYRAPARDEHHAPPAPPLPASGLQTQFDELLRFRDQLAAAAKALVDDYSRLLEQLTLAIETPPAPPPPTTAAGHVTFAVPPPTAPSTEGSLFRGRVLVEAGPFDDIAALAAFEEGLRGVPGTGAVAVRSFEGGRATIELDLVADVPLVFELRRASDQAFDVDHADADRLTVTMHSGSLPFPMRPANDREAPPAPPNGEAD
jgi:hypothetical protein